MLFLAVLSCVFLRLAVSKLYQSCINFADFIRQNILVKFCLIFTRNFLYIIYLQIMYKNSINTLFLQYFL